MSKSKLMPLVEGAVMVALATILSFIKVYELPMGGAVTLEMIPIVVFAFRRGTGSGLLTAFCHSVISLLFGLKNVGYCTGWVSMTACVLFDYIVAFSVLGLAKFFAKPFGEDGLGGVIGGTTVVCVFRFICHFVTGFLIWGEWMPESFTNVYWYSVVYNGSYMLPQTIVTVVVAAVLFKAAPKLFKPAE